MFNTYKNITHTAICVYDAAAAKKAAAAKLNKKIAAHVAVIAVAGVAIVAANVMLNSEEN